MALRNVHKDKKWCRSKPRYHHPNPKYFTIWIFKTKLMQAMLFKNGISANVAVVAFRPAVCENQVPAHTGVNIVGLLFHPIHESAPAMHKGLRMLSRKGFQ